MWNKNVHMLSDKWKDGDDNMSEFGKKQLEVNVVHLIFIYEDIL